MATTINHGQIAQINENGDIDIFYPKSFSKDVYINSNKDTLESFIGIAGNSLLNAIYPIGSIYMSVNNTNPSTFIGGTWAEWGAGRVPVGVSTDSEFNTVEKTGGEKTHTLTAAEMPKHTHTFTGSAVTSGNNSANPSVTNGSCTTGTDSVNHTHTFSGTTGAMNSNSSHGHNFLKEFNVAPGSSTGQCAGGGSASWSGSYIQKTNTDHTHNYSGTTSGVNTWHTHSVPNHTHTVSGTHTHSVTAKGTNSETGSSGAHNILQPYITCYMFKRTA